MIIGKYGLLSFFILLITILFCSCREKQTKDDLILFKTDLIYQIIDDVNEYSQFIIIPGSGCEGCISQAEKFVIDNASKELDRFMFIFTNVRSKKLLKLRLGNDILSQKNVVIDSSNQLHFRSIYPMLVEKSQQGNLVIKELKEKNFLLQ